MGPRTHVRSDGSAKMRAKRAHGKDGRGAISVAGFKQARVRLGRQHFAAVCRIWPKPQRIKSTHRPLAAQAKFPRRSPSATSGS
jgi:hypothetical protein